MYTGNSPRHSIPANPLSVYPCVYRELAVQFVISFGRRRFIPVYTGNSNGTVKKRYKKSVYPCVYRELFHWLKNQLIKCGLSLCIQGTQSEWPWLLWTDRFIPVYTGNSPIITYCFIIKILTVKFLPIF